MANVTCFAGCSYTSGTGFEKERFEPCFWPVMLHSGVEQLSCTQYVNVGIGGSSNELIFSTAAQAMADHCPKYMFVQWTSFPRLNILLGMETYASTQLFSWDAKIHDHNLHKISYTKEYLTNLGHRFLALEHPHNQIKNIVHFLNVLLKLANKFDCKIFFVNGLCSWDTNYFVKIEKCLPNQFTPMTQRLLDTKTRDDEEVFILYDKLHSEYQQYGGIQENHWLNLYDSLLSHKIDTNQDYIHPGQQSNQLYFDFLSKALTKKLSS